VRKYASLLLVIVFSAFAVFPVWYILSVSFRGDNSFQVNWSLWTSQSSFENYKALFTSTMFPIWLRNSVLVSGAVTIFGLSIAATAAYALSRFRVRGSRLMLLVLLATQMFPPTMLLLPFYLILSKLGLANNFWGLLIVYASTALPFCIWQLKSWFDTLPKELEEAALVDGCNRLQVFFRVVLPISGPAMVITALFQFTTAWTEYAVAAVVLQDPELYTLPVGLKSFQASMATQWGLYAAAAVLVSVPVVIMFTLLSRALISGLTLGSVKG
jgi:arabinogalactan oligomer/maltooligosaccharide transport system permease protein